jgi:hypothetical protein
MTAQIIQAIVIGMIVAICSVMAFRRLLPGLSQRMQVAMARSLSEPKRSAALRVVGRWLQPAEAKSGGCGTGDGCGGCGGCGSSTSAPVDAQPLVFHPKPIARNK